MPLFTRKMETRRLHNTEIKQLARTLRGVPYDASTSREAKYRRYAKEDIRNLPRRLRASHLTLHATTLCTTHNGLDAHLIDDMWSWLRFEFEGAIGRFLYPIIMSSSLSDTEEFKVRQLEPVLQMWYRPWTLEQSAPLGHEPIQCGMKWAYQQDQCPACMLSRIGSDTDVLFAIFAGMVGRFNTRSLANAEAQGGSDAWKKTKSKRIRFVKNWLRATEEGEAILVTAGELGMKMKRLRREWKQEQRRLRSEQQLSPPQPWFGRNLSRTTLDRHAADPKIGPVPRPAVIQPLSPAVQLGFGTSASPTYGRHHITASTGQCNQRSAGPFDRPLPSQPPAATVSTRSPLSNSPCTLRTASNVSLEDPYPAPLRPNHPRPYQDKGSTLAHDHYRLATGSSPPPPSSAYSTRSYSPSLASTATIASYNNPLHALPIPGYPTNPFHDTVSFPSPPIRMPAALDLEEDTADDVGMLPEPESGSVYEAFGKGHWDGQWFERVDEEEFEGEGEDDGDGPNDGVGAENWVQGKGRVSSSGTNWDDLY